MKLTEELFRSLYIDELKTCEEIGKIVGLTKSGVRHWKRKWKIPEIKGERFYLKIKNKPLTDNVKSILTGSLLGDGSITHHMEGYHLSITHSLKQEQYVLWKKDQIGDIIQANPCYYIDETTNSKCVRIQSIKHPELYNLRKLWYPNDLKILTMDNIKSLDALGLAIWYMDDGFVERRQGYFASCGFSYEENEMLVCVLKSNFDIEATITSRFSSKQNKYYLILKLDEENFDKLKEIIRPIVIQIPDMLYKFGNDN